MKNEQIFHIRKIDNQYRIASTGGYTIIAEEAGDGFTRLRVSLCSVEDNYSKKKGVEKARKEGAYQLNVASDVFQEFLKNDSFANVTNTYYDVFQHADDFDFISKAGNIYYGTKSDKNSVNKQLGKAQKKIAELEAQAKQAEQIAIINQQDFADFVYLTSVVLGTEAVAEFLIAIVTNREE